MHRTHGGSSNLNRLFIAYYPFPNDKKGFLWNSCGLYILVLSNVVNNGVSIDWNCLFDDLYIQLLYNPNAKMKLFIYLLLNCSSYFFLSIKLVIFNVLWNLQEVYNDLV